MRTDRKLPPQAWLQEETTKRVVDALTARGQTVRFVGGCVRNAILGEPVRDLDIATPDPPETVIELLEAAEIRAVPTGLEHGTVTAVTDGRHFEITTLRKDVATYGRHADVEFTEDWYADAARRDFTVNALYADPDGDIHDPVGGLADLDAGRIRFIGDAAARIEEDYLRILRFFRFHAWYGRGEIDRDGLLACEGHIGGLGSLSGERVQAELLKLLGAPAPVATLRIMAAVGVLPAVLPEAGNFARLERLCEIETEQLFLSEADPVLRLAALVETDADGMRALSERLRLSNADRGRLVAIVSAEEKIVCYLSVREMRRVVYRLGKDRFKDIAMLRWAEDPKDTNSVQWRALIAMAEAWEPPVMPLTGEQVMAAGVPEGPEIGRVMREVEEWWIDSDFTDDKFSIIERLKAVVQATVY